MSPGGRIPLILITDTRALAMPWQARRREGAFLSYRGGMTAEGIFPPDEPDWALRRSVAPMMPGYGAHGRFCGCCGGRDPLITALHQLFLDHVRGACPDFSFVICLCNGGAENEVRAKLKSDGMIMARYEF